MISTSFFIVLLIVVVGLFYVLVKNNKDQNSNSLLQAYHEKYDELTNSTRILKTIVTLPPTVSVCYEKSTDDKKIQDKIRDAINDVNAAIVSLQGSYTALTSDAVWKTLNKTQQDAINIIIPYQDALTAANKILTQSNSITINNTIIKSWSGVYPCEDICQTNGVTGIDKAIYTVGGNCTCPTGYYPQLDDNSFVKCIISYDKSFSFRDNFSTATTAIIGKDPIFLIGIPMDPSPGGISGKLDYTKTAYGIRVTNISNTSTVIDTVTINISPRPAFTTIDSSIADSSNADSKLTTTPDFIYLDNNIWDMKLKLTLTNSQSVSPTLSPNQSLIIVWYVPFNQKAIKPIALKVTSVTVA